MTGSGKDKHMANVIAERMAAEFEGEVVVFPAHGQRQTAGGRMAARPY